ncbi:probable RNA-directed DNA polymerase from transposon X-element [Trichonephila clavipes]|nr:probable RNA-directed DNA polymerase from transposon X-element [Trichonephila clavipes]
MRDFVDKHAPDVFLIQETHLRPEDSFKIPNYRCYRNDRTHPAPGRGVTAVLIKNCIPHYHVPTPPQFTGVEATLLMLTPKDHEPILIGSTYIPPINDYFRNLGAALDTIFNITNMTICVGDFNAKHTSWGCPVNDARGNRLYRYVVNSGIDVIAPPTPTRFGTASATIIDYALMKNLNWPCTIDSISELSSDHNPIKLNFPRTPSFEIPLPNFTLTGNSSQKILQTMITCTFHRPTQPQRLSPKSMISLGELKQLFRDRNRARKLWQFTRFPLHKTELNRIQNKIKRKVGLYRQQLWEEHLTSLDAEDGSLWGTARAFRKKATPISALNGPNGVALSDTNKTDLIAKSLESQFQLNNIQNPQKDHISNIVETYITDHTNNTDPIPPALPSEILSECMENCSCNSYPETREKSQTCGIPSTDISTTDSSKLAEKIIAARLNDYLKMKISLFRSSTGSVLVSPPPINFFE